MTPPGFPTRPLCARGDLGPRPTRVRLGPDGVITEDRALGRSTSADVPVPRRKPDGPVTRAITVEARTCAVVYRHGVRTGVLAAGRHRRPAGSTVVPVDLRERLLAVAPQEVPTADGASVRVTAAVRWSVTDPVAFVEVADDPEAVVYLATQVALREALAAVETDRLARRGSLPLDEVVAAVRTAAVAVACPCRTSCSRTSCCRRRSGARRPR